VSNLKGQSASKKSFFSLIMTIASQHAKATHVSERLGWLIDHSMLSCRHLCAVCVRRSSRPFIYFFRSVTINIIIIW